MKKKRLNKTKEQLLADLRSNEKFVKKMKFTKEVFYPALEKASESIDDAVQLLSGFNTTLMQQFLGLMKDKKMKEMKLVSKLDKTSPNYKEFKKLLALFDDMSVFDAKEYLEGMRAEIQLFVSEENKKRPLSSLETKWLDQI